MNIKEKKEYIAQHISSLRQAEMYRNTYGKRWDD